jgi:hypothetical protein
MNELTRQTSRALTTGAGAGGDGGFFDVPESEDGLANVSHGPFVEQLPVANLSVSQVRERFADRLDIHPDAVALLDGSPVDDATTVRAGQTLAFIRPAGEKGC